MARLWHAGAEIEGDGTANTYPDGQINGAVTRDTVTFRSGLAAWKCDSAAGNAAAAVLPPVLTVTSATHYWRAYVNAAAAPTAATIILGASLNTNGVRMRTDGGLELVMLTAPVTGSASASIADGTWHRVELKFVYDGSGQATSGEFRLDGVTVQTCSGTEASAGRIIRAGGWAGSPGANKVIYVDDVAVNDATGATNNTWCGAGKVVLLRPVADSAVGGSWTDSGGSATGLFGSVDNTPPAGVADTTANAGHNIRNAGANTSYDAQLGAYSDSVASGGGGMTTGDTVNAVIPAVTAGAPVVTGAKTGSYGIVSNPAITNRVFTGGTSAAANFWRGTAPGTYPAGGWGWEQGTLTEAPSVTLSTKPVARLTITGGTTSRIAMSCFMGLYVEYTPASTPPQRPPQFTNIAVSQASSW